MPTIIADRYALLPQPPRKGRLAEVFPATDLHADARKVAVKLFHAGLPNDEVVKEAFERESHRLMDLKHEHIISMLDFGTDAKSGRPFLVLEWGGGLLEDWLKGQPAFANWSDYYDLIGRSLLEAIAFAHSRETVHRELKPSDFLRDDSGLIRLADFGVSKFPTFFDAKLDIGEFLKTNEPFSPPNGYDPERSFTTDVYGFAAVSLYFLTRGKLRHWKEIPGVLRELEAPAAVRAVLNDALQPAASERPEDGQVLVTKLEAAARKTRGAVARPVCSLGLTTSALDKVRACVPGLETRLEVEKFVANDLNEVCSVVAFRLRDTAGNWIKQEDQFLIYGETLRLHVAIDRVTKASLAILGCARPESSDQQERERNRGWPASFRFVLTPPVSERTGKAAVEAIAEAVVEHESQERSRRRHEEEERLFWNWQEMLQLRIEHGKAGKRLHYAGYDTDGNRVTFRTKEAVDQSILEETWAVEGTRIQGVVDAVEGSTVTLYIEGVDEPRPPESGTLAIDAKATEKQLKTQLAALDQLRGAASARNTRLKARILHPSDCETEATPPIASWFNPGLDENKKLTIAAALQAKDFYLVEGPPGTGKTTFIAELILQFLHRFPKKRILLTSQTHIAVDNAIEKVISVRPDLKLVRIGWREGKISEQAQSFLLQNRVREWRERVKDQATRFLKKRAEQQGIDTQGIQMGLDLGVVVRQTSDLALAQESETDRLGELERIHRRLAERDGEGRPLASGEEAASLTSEKDRIEDDLYRLQRTLRERSEALRASKERFAKQYPEYAELLTKPLPELVEWQDGLIGDSMAAQKFKTLFELSKEWLERFSLREDCQEAILMDSSLVAGTCIGISTATTDQDEYGLCILDEASKASFTEALVPLVRAEKWILVGDRRQLPPFLDSALRDRKALEQHEIDRELVSETLLNRLDRLKLPAACRSMLTQQHRMVPAIGDLVSTVFYDGQLQSVGAAAIPKALTQAMPKPIVWYSTSKDPQRFEQSSRSSWINMLEVSWVRQILDRLNFWARAAAGSRSENTQLLRVAVLTGYSAQRWQLDSALSGDRREFLDVEVHSVDAYQGKEADFVVLSVTRSNKNNQPGFLRERERINVALSRAKFGLCLVGDADFCYHVASGSPLSEVYSYIRAHPETCHFQEGIK